MVPTQPVALDDLIRFVRAESLQGDALVHLGDAVLVAQRLDEMADHLVGHFVDQARRAGSSWAAIGEQMGVSKQAAQKRFVLGAGDEPRELDAVFFARFTARAHRSISAAYEEAHRLRHDQIGTEHLLLGLLHEREGLAARALAAQDVTLVRVRAALDRATVPGTSSSPDRALFAPRAKKVLQLAVREALHLGRESVATEHYVGTEHVLLAILDDDDGVAARLLRELAVSEQQTREWIKTALAEMLEEPHREPTMPDVFGGPSAGAHTADIGHVHLKVADLARAITFYRDLIGMHVQRLHEGAAFLAFGNYHHHLGINTWHSDDGVPPAPEATGLFHFAVRYPNRRDLASALKRLLDAGVPIDSSSDCGGTADSIYLRDPDQNGLELTWDRPRESRPDPLPADDQPLDLEALLAELGADRA